MQQRSRFLIGIDLGTTNSVVAYINTHATEGGIRVFDVPQLFAAGEIRALPALPSFLYFPTEHDRSGGVSLPWEEHPASITGVMAREQGALAPGRQVTSAKSWLCDPAMDRRGNILPLDAEASVPKLSPIQASARYLTHLRDAWNYEHAAYDGVEGARFEDQEIVLTVPASFDAEARELTVEAAQRAGLKNFLLLEEPIAAFYAWIASHQDRLAEDLHDGELVLICDVGGGTSDFSLVRVRIVSGRPQFERTAIGEHLLLGGDNLDIALQRMVEDKLGGPRLSAGQRHALRRACCDAKERLLSDSSMDSFPVTILGGGRSVVAGALRTELTRKEVEDVLLGGFLPSTLADEMPAHGARRTGLRELGLHYASDPAITRHLAEFLTRAAAGMSCEPGASIEQPSRMQRPDAILFNGGFFAPAVARERIVETVAGWFNSAGAWRPRVLSNEAMAAAVAIGAAYYGQVRHGSGLRIRAGSPRTFYVGLRSDEGLRGVCVLPSGVQEGTTLSLDRDFSVLANRPVSFTLYSSTTRCEPHSGVTSLEGNDLHRHAPLVTVLRYGKMRDQQLSVRLTASFTEVGTLELWCNAVNSPHRWRLQFELRGAEGEQREEPARPHAVQSRTSDEQIDSAIALLRRAFATGGGAGEPIGPEALGGQLEAALQTKKDSWSAAATRSLSDALLEVGLGRRKSPRHEARWLNLLGFCLRPGFGMPQDDQRIANVWKLYQPGLVFKDDLQAQVEWLVFWRRITAGLNASHQNELHRFGADMMGLRGKKGPRLNRQLEHEAWRLLASLEHLPASIRSSLGQQLLPKLKKEPATQAWLWSLARFGARIPLYGPLNCVVSAAMASEWLEFLLQMDELTADAAFAITLLAARTDDPERDIDDKLRRRVISS
ncbi:MAG TPA: Hsp70 family protein, partial [Terriglobales bacterium]|nr:Hsp70 family protein [Terriglobales bacterium]